jgi:hypothetical protein
MVRALAAAAAASPALAGAGAAQQPLSADEIIARHVEARGGGEALAGLKSLRREGRLVVPGFNAELKTVEIKQRPSFYRLEITFQGLTQVTAYDGKEAWRIDPFQGRKDPERLSPDSADAKSAALAADIDTPLVDYRKKGATVDNLGLEEVDGTPAYKLRLRMKSGDEAIYFIDPDSFMIIRLLETQAVRGAQNVIESDYGEYEKAGGVYVPMTEEFGDRGAAATDKQKLLFETAAAVDALPASEFAFPAGK